MNHPWQQPIRPMQILVPDTELWADVVFIRPAGDRGWEAITRSGNTWSSSQTMIREVTA